MIAPVPAALPKSAERIGVFGGSFDPVHWGHLHIALLAREAARLDAVLFVPAARPPHKNDGLHAPDADRIAMLELALADEDGSFVSGVELAPPAPRYTVDTLRALAGLLPGRKLHFIMGMDSLLELSGWREPDAILSEHRVVAVDRPGFDPGLVDPEYASRCRLVRGNPFAISSTSIRDRLSRDLSIRHLAPRAVADYIETRRLYASPTGGPRP